MACFTLTEHFFKFAGSGAEWRVIHSHNPTMRLTWGSCCESSTDHIEPCESIGHVCVVTKIEQ